MSLFVSSLNSGSNGNCYYIGTLEEGVLVDAGISCKETEKRLKRAGLNIRKIKAIFISHEHGDHIHGAPALSKKYKLPVYITPATRANCHHEFLPELVRPFKAYEDIEVGGMIVTAFPKIHDAADPHSFIVRFGAVKVGVLTDIGKICDHVIKHFKECHAVFLESNYDEMLLDRGAYPHHLKVRIRGGWGHLSNSEALTLFRQHRSERLSHLFLSHLSEDNNRPKLAQQLFGKHAGGTSIIVAPRDRETKVYHIRDLVVNAPELETGKVEEAQLALF